MKVTLKKKMVYELEEEEHDELIVAIKGALSIVNENSMLTKFYKMLIKRRR